MIHPAKHLLAIWLVTCVATSGCRSAPEGRDRPMPFHVAVIPVDVSGGQAESEGRLYLELDSGSLSQRLAETLEASQFERASLLAYPPEMSREQFLENPTYERDLYWLEQASELGADLIITSTVEYAASVENQTNDRVWYNVPLFLLGGPFCWFVPDRDYEFEARIDARVHDLAAIAGNLNEADLRNREADLTRSMQRDYSGTSMNFTKRAGKNVGYYLLSIVWPASFLAKETKSVKAQLEERVTERLTADLAVEVGNRANLIREASDLYTFTVEEMEVRREDGSNQLYARIELDQDRQKAMGYYRVECDGKPLPGGFFEEAPQVRESPDGTPIAQYELVVPLPASFDNVRLWLSDGSQISERPFSLEKSAREAVYRRD